MTYSVFVTQSAERDLDGIALYLTEQLGNPSAALRMIDGFEALVTSLEETPTAYPYVRDELLMLAGYRWAPVSSYMVFFTFDETAGTVMVERVLHGSRNWKDIV